MPVPVGARRGELYSVALTSVGNGWAAGYSGSLLGPDPSLMLHCNGTVWRRVVVPAPRAALPSPGSPRHQPGTRGAVGYTGRGKVYIARWDGRAWHRMHHRARAVMPNWAAWPRRRLRHVWAVGVTLARRMTGVILHWNGTAWTRMRIPHMPAGSLLGRVAATSARHARAADVTGDNKTLILRCNGSPLNRPALADALRAVIRRSCTPMPGRGSRAVSAAPTTAEQGQTTLAPGTR